MVSPLLVLNLCFLSPLLYSHITPLCSVLLLFPGCAFVTLGRLSGFPFLHGLISSPILVFVSPLEKWGCGGAVPSSPFPYVLTCFFLADSWRNEKKPPVGKLALGFRELRV